MAKTYAHKKTVKKTARRAKTAQPKTNATQKALAKLNHGIQWKQTLYGENVALNTSGTNRVAFRNGFVRDIPKYRNDPTATNKQANLDQCRTSDKLLIKGFNVKYIAVNYSSKTSLIRVILFRNNSWNEAVDDSLNASNWFKNIDGASTSPNTLISTFGTLRFNDNLVKNKRVDILSDRKMYMSPASTSSDGKDIVRSSFYIPLNQIAQFESKGDSTSADDLKTGTYTMLICIANSDQTTGDMVLNYEVNVVWAQA